MALNRPIICKVQVPNMVILQNWNVEHAVFPNVISAPSLNLKTIHYLASDNTIAFAQFRVVQMALIQYSLMSFLHPP